MADTSNKNTNKDLIWHQHIGGETCPISDQDVKCFEIKLRSGIIHFVKSKKPSRLRWKHLGKHDDIFAYRVISWASERENFYSERELKEALESQRRVFEKDTAMLEERLHKAESKININQDFSPGSVVSLKSGGCKMTVISTTESYAKVIWLDANNHMVGAEIEKLLLKKVDES